MTHSINVPLARRVLAQITAAPERWNQGTWLDRPYPAEQQSPTETVDNCRTSGCFAGWAVVLSGYKTDFDANALDVPPAVRDTARRLLGPLPDYVPEGRVTVRAAAAVALGLDREQTSELFGGSNTLRDLYDHLADYTDGEITLPADPPVWLDMAPDELSEYLHPRAWGEDDDED